MRDALIHDLAAGELTLRSLLSEVAADSEPACEVDWSTLASIAASVRAPHHTLRVVRFEASSLAELTLPALAVIDGGLAMLRKVGPRSVELELAGGQRRTLTREEFVANSGGEGLEAFLALARSGRFMARIASFLVRNGADLAKLGFLSLALSGLGLALPFATQLAIDRALPERSPKLLSLLALGTLLVAVQRAFFMWLEQRASLALSLRLELAIDSRLFDHLLRIPYAALVRDTIGSWLETLHGAQRIEGLVTDTLVSRILELSLALVCGIALTRHDPQLALLLFSAALLILALGVGFALRASALERGLIETSARQGEALYELLSGVLTLRICGASRRGLERWLERLLDVRTCNARMDYVGAIASATIGGLRELIGLATFVWVSHACLQGRLSVGALLSIVMLAERFIASAAGLASGLAAVWSARTHVARADALLALEDVTLMRGDAQVDASYAGDAVVLDDVWFRYGPDQPWVLQGYNLKVATLSRFTLEGRSGAGKSTILRLIAGLYTPERGSVRVCGRAPSKVAREIAYLPQVAHLFEGSIRQNLNLLSDASQEELEQAAEQSGLAAFVATLPMGYETILPAGGSTLSGGQRQLIMWTAAMASGRRLLLLDESLSQVDRVTRARLLAMCDQHACTIVSVDHEPLTSVRLASNGVQEEREEDGLSRDPFEAHPRSSGVVTQLIQETRYGD